jgi:predicted HTH transcriptional regulator
VDLRRLFFRLWNFRHDEGWRGQAHRKAQRLALDAAGFLSRLAHHRRHRITEQDGYFVVTFHGPNGNYDRLKVPEGIAGLIPAAVEAQLNERQRKIVAQVLKKGSVTSGWCRKKFGITYDTANRDFLALMKLNP